jgi:MFS family permease
MTLRAFWEALPRPGRWLLSTVAVQTLGRGMTLPFTIIYLSEVRGIPLGTAGSLMALIAVVALLVTGPGGALTDRVGARVVLLLATTAQLVGCVVLAFATTPAAFAVGFVLLGVNFGVSWTGFNVLIASVVSGSLRQQYFGVNFALVNLGIGVGGVVAGALVDVAQPWTFTAIFLADAVCMLVPIGLLLGPLRGVSGRRAQPEREPEDEAVRGRPAGGYGELLRRPAILWLTGATLLMTFVGYGQMEAGFPAFARGVGEVSTRLIGFAFAVNTVVIVGLQFAVLKRITGHRRTRVLLVMTALWAGAWLLLATTGLAPGAWAAGATVLGFMAVFALGETMMQSALPALVNDLVDDTVRGRANALSSGAFQAGTIVAPAVAGWLLGRGWWLGYVGVVLAGLAALAACALRLERLVTPEENGLSAATP